MLAGTDGYTWVALSAVSSGVAEIKQAIARAKTHKAGGRRTMLFVDEIHRLNKLQQVPFFFCLPPLTRSRLSAVFLTATRPHLHKDNPPPGPACLFPTRCSFGLRRCS